MPRNIRLNSTHYFIVKTSNKQELDRIAFNNSADVEFQSFINLLIKYTAKPYCFLVIDTTHASVLYILEKIF